MGEWKFSRSKSPSKTIRCEDCSARCQQYMRDGGRLPGPQVRYASVTLTESGVRRKLCGSCFAERKLVHDQEAVGA